MEKINLNIKISQAEIDFLAQTFDTTVRQHIYEQTGQIIRLLNPKEEKIGFEALHQELAHMRTFFEYMKKVAKHKLKGYFEKNELLLLVDLQNGTMLSPDFAYNPETLIFQLEDGATYEGLDQKWEVNIEELKEKIRKLDNLSCYFLQYFIRQFWDRFAQNMLLDEFYEQFKP